MTIEFATALVAVALTTLLVAAGIAVDAWRIRRRAEAELASAQQIGTQVSLVYQDRCRELAALKEAREQAERLWRDAEQFVTGGAG
ncbi:hypothetical protein [Streptomyces sp.]|uniref:hypothetical protein n=1 Tax=Streptomyces sp. TaxID=1931 RepID=UPI002F946025